MLLDVEFGGVRRMSVRPRSWPCATRSRRPRWATRRCSKRTWTPGWSSGSCVPPPGWCCANALLSEGGEEIYRLVLRECCAYLVEVVTTLPKFSSAALTELLRRETAVLDTLSRVLDRLPERRGVDDFAADYRRDGREQAGPDGTARRDASRREPALSAEHRLHRPDHARSTRAGDSRLVIRSGPGPVTRSRGRAGCARRACSAAPAGHWSSGNAGSGKTTLLQWLAVRSALGDFGSSLTEWNDAVPFFIPLRRYVNRTLPAAGGVPAGGGKERGARDARRLGARAAAGPGERWSSWTGSTRCPRASASTCGAGWVT